MAGKTVIQELVAKLGFDIDQKTVEDFEAGLASLRNVAGAVAGAVTASAAAVFAWAESAAAAGEEAVLNANALNINAEAYQRMAYAASMSGVNAEMLRASLIKLTRSAQEAGNGNADLAATFRELGLDARAFGDLSADQQLATIADALNGVEEPGRRVAMTMQLLGEQGPRLASLLGEGSDGIRALGDEASALGIVMSNDAAAAGEAFGDQLEQLKLTMQGVKNTIGLEVMPVVSDAIGAFREWFIANRELIRSSVTNMLRGMASAARTGIAVVSRLVGWVQDAVDAFGGWNAVLQAVRFVLIGFVGYQVVVAMRSLIAMVQALTVAYRTMGSTALIANAKALAGPLAIGAAIAALVLIAQDFITFLRGGDSLIGRFVERFAESEGFLGMVARWLLDLRDIINNWPANWALIVGYFRDLWTGAVDWVVGLIEGLVGVVTSVGEAIGAAWSATVVFFVGLWNGALDAFRAVFDAIGAVIEWYVTTTVNNWTAVYDFVRGIIDGIGSAFGTVFDGIASVARNVFGFIVNGIASVADGVLRLAEVGGRALGINADGIARARENIAEMRAAFGDGGGVNVTAGATQGTGTTNNQVNAGGVTVQVNGTTNMGPDDLRRATQDGTARGLQQVLDQTNRTFAGAEA